MEIRQRIETPASAFAGGPSKRLLIGGQWQVSASGQAHVDGFLYQKAV